MLGSAPTASSGRSIGSLVRASPSHSTTPAMLPSAPGSSTCLRALPFKPRVVSLDLGAGRTHERQHERCGALRIQRVEARGDPLPHAILEEELSAVDRTVKQFGK